MTCTSMRTTGDAPTAQLTREGFKYTAPYLVVTNDAADGPAQVAAYVQALGYTFGSPYGYLNDSDPLSYLDGIAPTRLPQSTTHWRVTLSYSPLDKDEEKPDEDGQPTKDPLLWRQEHQMGFAAWQKPAWKANNLTAFPHPDSSATATTPYTRSAGTIGPVTNSAGVPMDPTLMCDVYDRVWQVTAYGAEWDGDSAKAYMGFLNIQAVKYHDDLISKYGFKQVGSAYVQYGWKCTNYSAAARYANETAYWQYSLEFRYRNTTWIQEVLDRGLTARGAPGGATGTGNDLPGTAATGSAPAIPVLDGIGRRVPEMVLFDGQGYPIAAGAAKEASGFYFKWLTEHDGVGVAFFQNIPFKLFKAA